MAVENQPFETKDNFLLTLTGRITVEFLDEQIMIGEFTAQDRFNIFLTIDGEPVMIPRSQIRYIKGEPGQQIERDTASETYLEAEPAEAFETILPEPELVEADSDIEVEEFLTAAQEEYLEEELAPAAVEPDQALAEAEPVEAAEAEMDELEDTGLPLVFRETPDSTAPQEPAPLPVVEGADEITAEVENLPAFEEEEEDWEGMTLLLEDEEEEPDDVTVILEEEEEEVYPQLICTTGPHTGEVCELTKKVITLGRATDNIFSLSKDKEISRHHTVINVESGQFIIQDQNSLNGTFVNDERIDGPRYLEDGDVILIGVSTLKFQKQS